ncbi:hypothetical protein [Oerskovia sp. Root22]|uniref:hypothetical protein n=1 Tax=Oerskovia sp. Root22 TaxID=1736494 RepID=UPI0021012E1A
MAASTEELTVRPVEGPSEYPALVEIWRSAVRATHEFLDDADFERIETDLSPVYFPAVTLVVAERGGGGRSDSPASPRAFSRCSS